MKIAIVISSMSAGGAERVTANLANAWARRGWEVHLVTVAPAAVDFYPLVQGVTRHALNLAGESRNGAYAIWANARRVFALRRYLRALKPDVVLGMMTPAAVHAILATSLLKCRVIVAERTYPPLQPIGGAWEWQRKMTYPFAYRVVMLTSEGLDWLHTRIPRARGTVIPNPVMFPLPATEPRLPPEVLAPTTSKLLLAVGRLDRGKQFDRLLDAFGALAARFPQWNLVILGEGPERLALEAKVERLGLMKRAHLPGKAGNVGDWYGRADLYVMSSRYEGFPNTLAEALAHGVAAISYDCDTGPRDLIRHGQNGLLVHPVGDVAALSDALDRLMANEPERLRMAANAAQVRERYSMQRILAMWDGLFLPGEV